MQPRHKFVAGAVLITASVGYLMVSGVRDTGVYFVTPAELALRVSSDTSIHNVGIRMGARVVTGTIRRDVATQTVYFDVSDGSQTYPVVYRGLPPDTFDGDVDVVVEGRLAKDGVFHATSLLAKCGSRYEAQPTA
jgi:cytochrome c-type biogenesis protein CcmE